MFGASSDDSSVQTRLQSLCKLYGELQQAEYTAESPSARFLFLCNPPESIPQLSGVVLRRSREPSGWTMNSKV